MTTEAAEVFAEALRLDREMRAELAAQLVASLDGPVDLDVEAAWSTEVDARIAAIEAGTIGLEPWDEVRGRIEAKLRRA